MSTTSALSRAAFSLACLGLLLPPSAFGAAAATEPQPRPSVRVADAALGADGALRGRVSDPQGKGMPATRVVLAGPKGPIGETMTDDEGRFAFLDLRQGLYVVAGGEGFGVYRVWPEAIAPPSAKEGVLIVSDGRLVRGQGGLYPWISEHFWLTSALVAAAIAVPTALITARRSASP